MLRPFDEMAVRDGGPVILYGAALYGELAYHALGALGIPVFAFCDRVQAGKQFLEKDILAPEQLRRYPDAHVLICATKGLGGIMHYLESIGWERFYEISGLLPFVEHDTLPPYCKALSMDEWIEKYRFYLPGAIQNQSGLTLSFVALSITERCTLRCEKCSVLAQYYSRPRDDTWEDIMTPFERFLACIDSVSELQVGGGEPLLHKDLGRILTWCLEQEKIKEISIFTNSTILPDEALAEVLAHPKIKLLLDDYGPLSRKLSDIIRLCDERGIRYLIQKFERWDDLGDYKDKRETDEQVAEKFRYCSFGNVNSFLRGKLYRCTTAARIADLGMVPDEPEDYVDFTYQQDREIWRQQICRLLYDKRYHLGCKLCNGISTHSLGIPVAEQLKLR